MINEVLFRYEERLFCPIKEVALDTDVQIFWGHFGENTYYADLAGIAKKYTPESILEIGCRYGYSAYAFAFGCRAGGRIAAIRFFGVDAEHYNYRSNAVAAENVRRFAPWMKAQFFTHDTGAGLPEEITEPRIGGRLRTFDMINVDGDHSYGGTIKDLQNVWPHLNEGGILIVDDIKMPEVNSAARMFMHDLTQAGQGFIWQLHENETNLILIQKRSDLAPPPPEPVAPVDPATGLPPGVISGHIDVPVVEAAPVDMAGDHPDLPALTEAELQPENFVVGISEAGVEPEFAMVDAATDELLAEVPEPEEKPKRGRPKKS